MYGKTIYEPSCPVTQTAEAVKSLITFYNHGHEPAEMPAFFRLTGEMVLVQSNKKDVYYVVTPKSCSCPSATYRPNQACKHQRNYFPQPKKGAEPVDSIMPSKAGFRPVVDPTTGRDPKGSIKPAGKWPGGFNGPVNMPGGDLLKEMEKKGYAMSFEADY
jgi:hypothetical protein